MKFINICSFALLNSVLFFAAYTTTQKLYSQNIISAEIKSQLTTDQAVIGYFGPKDNPESSDCMFNIEPTYYTKPVENGYYRVLLGRNAQGHFLIQNFYERTKTPQSSPVWIINPLKLFNSDSSYIEGPIIIYRENGKIASKLTNKNGEAIEGEDYYPNGQIGSKFNTEANGNTHVQLWYASGKKAAHYIINLENELIKSELWTEDGKSTDDAEDVTTKVHALLKPNFQ